MLIRQQVSQILNLSIPQDKWQEYALLLDRAGRPTRFETNKIMFALCQAIEKLQAVPVMSSEVAIKLMQPDTATTDGGAVKSGTTKRK